MHFSLSKRAQRSAFAGLVLACVASAALPASTDSAGLAASVGADPVIGGATAGQVGSAAGRIPQGADTSMEMDVSLESTGPFWRDWHFVTARHRQDTGELRIIYANDIAWAALQSKKLPFPEGAAFAKIGFTPEDDELFPSSKVPGSAMRYQLMVKDSKKYPKSRGWGYALWMRDQKLFEKGYGPACVACHELA